MEIGELLVNLGFKADTTKLRDFIHDLGDLNISALIGGGALGLMVDQIKNIMETADGAARSFNIFHGITGLSRQKLQQWDQVAQETGVSAGTLASTVDGLQNRIENMKKTGEGAAAFNILHIDPTKMTDTFTSLEMILEAVKNMPPAEQKWYLGFFGINEQLTLMIPYLDRIRAITTNSNKDFNSMSGFMRLITDLSLDWKKLMIEIGAILENTFIGDMLKGLDIIIKFISHWQILIPLLGTAAYLMGQIAATTIIASLANPATAPFAVGALATGGVLLGASLLGALRGNVDNSKDITMHNDIKIYGDDATKNQRAWETWNNQLLDNADKQNPLYSV